MGELWIGPWRVDPCKSVREQKGYRVRVEPKAMRVLVHLAERAGEEVAREEILRAVWEDSRVKPEVLTNAIWELRRRSATTRASRTSSRRFRGRVIASLLPSA